MSIIQQLSSQQGHKNNDANIQLAKEIASTQNHDAIKELVNNLNNKDKKIQNDCIKTLYETAYIAPSLIQDYYTTFLGLLKSKNNRMVWGSMTVLTAIAALRSKELFQHLDLIWETIRNGSVITIDNGVELLSQLNTVDDYFEKVDPLLTEILWNCPMKQLPMYIEKSVKCINDKNKEVYTNIIKKRKAECEKDNQLKRLNKILKKIN